MRCRSAICDEEADTCLHSNCNSGVSASFPRYCRCSILRGKHVDGRTNAEPPPVVQPHPSVASVRTSVRQLACEKGQIKTGVVLRRCLLVFLGFFLG